ncbi:MAG: isopentenyl phosphate kinase family protein [archaeon]|nr:isopentenyl phosphate kinase family protein [archaeon]
MEGRELVIVKLGGSLITHKDKPLSINLEALDIVSNALSKSDLPLVLVHGGGSFGHYFAEKYGLKLKPSRVSAEGVAKTRLAMLKLDLKILNSLDRHGMNPYPLPPSNFVGYSVESQRRVFFSLIDYGLTPITYGDVLPKRGGFYVLSGDEITRMLSETLRPTRAVFLLNVDGIFEDLNQPESLIEELKPEDLTKIKLKSTDMDVTGGMKLKIKEAMKIAESGVDVIFVSGRDSERIVRALKGEQTKGTLVRGDRIG